MNKYRKIGALLFLSGIMLAAVPASAEGFRVDLNYLTFQLPDDTAYIELQYLIYGNGLSYREASPGQYRGTVRADITLKAADGSGFITDRTFRFLTELYPDTLRHNKKNNYNLSRIPLPRKVFELYVCLRDENDSNARPLCHHAVVDLRFDRNRVSASGLLLIGAYTSKGNYGVFTKNNLNLIPYFSRFYPAQVDTLTYMWEIYNTDKVFPKNDVGLVHSYITSENGHEAVSNEYSVRLNFSPTAKYIHFLSFPIGTLPSGNYCLRNTVYAPDGTILLNDSLFFQRSNPQKDKNGIAAITSDSIPIDTLKQYIDYLLPIAKGSEVDFISQAKKETDYVRLSQFFLYFWTQRNPDDPWDAWYRYYGDVKRVNHNYTTLRFKGYKTDRGFYYLKYGPPSDIEYHPIENGLNPYEIWRYYYLDDQTDVWFIFGDLDLTTKNYTMICSNKKDEIYDPRWKFRLKPKDVRPTDIEMTE